MSRQDAVSQLLECTSGDRRLFQEVARIDHAALDGMIRAVIAGTPAASVVLNAYDLIQEQQQ
jgi:hypothetical protein